jgi:hypothetical protein
MTLAIHTRAKEGMQDFATAALEETFLDSAVDTPLIKSISSIANTLSFSAICRTFSSGGTRIRTGDTMIFSHMQKPLGMRKTRVGKRICVHSVPLGTITFCPYSCATVDTPFVTRASDRLTHLSGYSRPALSFGDVSGRNHKETSVSCVVSLTSATFNASRSVSSRGSAERDKERKLRSRLEPLTCSLRVSLFLIPNPAKDGYFAGTHESALSAKYPPISLNGASTADNC